MKPEVRPVTTAEIGAYTARRAQVLESLDEVQIRAWLAGYGLRWPSGPAFWVRVHRQRAFPLSGCSEAARAESERWLAERAGQLFWDDKLGPGLERAVSS